MIVVMKAKASETEFKKVIERIKQENLDVHISKGKEVRIIGVVGDVRRIEPEVLQAFDGVERVIRILHPFKLASRDFKPENTTINVDGVIIGGGKFIVSAGPCAVEGEEMLTEVAFLAKKCGASILRGGIFKPRTSPYSFQGLGLDGLEILQRVKEKTGLPIITEIMSPEHVGLISQYVDIFQIGARNMQNFPLLQAVGRTEKPVLLKRGLMASGEEWLQAAEYVLSEGNPNVILCERGIRTFEGYTRNTLDLSIVPVIKKLSHLPVFVDPSHGTGHWDLVTPMAMGALAVGADGIMVEVHPNPEKAFSDGPQSLKPKVFAEMMQQLAKAAEAFNRPLPFSSERITIPGNETQKGS